MASSQRRRSFDKSIDLLADHERIAHCTGLDKVPGWDTGFDDRGDQCGDDGDRMINDGRYGAMSEGIAGAAVARPCVHQSMRNVAATPAVSVNNMMMDEVVVVQLTREPCEGVRFVVGLHRVLLSVWESRVKARIRTAKASAPKFRRSDGAGTFADEPASDPPVALRRLAFPVRLSGKGPDPPLTRRDSGYSPSESSYPMPASSAGWPFLPGSFSLSRKASTLRT